MPETLLHTKLFIPPPRPNLVQRQRLIDQLNQGLLPGRKLTFTSVPAGFGKATLVSEWASQRVIECVSSQALLLRQTRAEEEIEEVAGSGADEDGQEVLG